MTDFNLDLLLGTHNRGKAVEIKNALGALGLHFHTLEHFGQAQTVSESGTTYEENAVLKAKGYAQQCGLWTLADDSGLEVEALNHAPGVLSARYAGAGASDGERIERLLQQLALNPTSDRRARFVSVVALADLHARIIKVEYGDCEGTIIHSPRGSNGFGYDPIFVPQGFDRTFAELPSNTKDVISHRGKALRAMREFLARSISKLDPEDLSS
jgi:XTP/dITP diphosphohydrolase